MNSKYIRVYLFHFIVAAKILLGGLFQGWRDSASR